ncbi:MAG: outer membrane beta-barrel protein [Candidatus Aminicenantes bacterium]|nr:outer membrane beta-barrel protein [Candidatus Aminicenantes bacterium]NIM77939.1 outer membrane beta-barrel protein [Candidatus Aminicenantes bacterium]NIN22756.1 outer membrane beta-barrel protein [Candidatus Aminicenantes bacterium]NIN45922.1 outer membrane beta-barrel protein [Candidatus Aminicenantes bacterium]NIN89398.1 outer membrane beta-barrel protein [Candidatus Aminicenantes bacterium]
MKCGRQDLQLLFIGICLILVSINFAYGERKVDMSVRPYAILTLNDHMELDGLFDSRYTKGYKIGVHLENVGDETISNVKVRASFEDGSGIVLKKKESDSSITLVPKKSVKVLFEASFHGIKPGKYPLTLEVSGNKNFQQTISRDVFVIRSEVDPNDPNKWAIHTGGPKGKISFNKPEFADGSNLGSAGAVSAYKWTKEDVPNRGKFSPQAYSDPWWKVIGSIAPVGRVQTAIDERIASVCGADYGDTIRSIVRASFSASALVVTSDETDPFRQGQENTYPGPDEITTKEEVEVSIDYPSEPVVGTGFIAVVQWTYTRTTNVKTYPPHKSKKQVRNTHFIRRPEIKIKRRKSGDEKVFIITARTRTPRVRNNEAHFVANLFKANDTQLKEVVQSIVLRDDGHQGDRKAADGTYTGIVSSHDLPIDTPLNVFVFGFDINNAAVSDPPLVAAKEIGGVLISTPSFKAYALEPDSTIEVKEEIFSLYVGLKPPVWSFCIPDYFDKLKEDPDVIVTSSADTDRFFGGVDLSGEYNLGNSHKLGLSAGYQILPKGRFRQVRPLAMEGGRIKMDLSTVVIPLKLYYKLPVNESFFFKFAGGLDYYISTIDYTRNIPGEAIDTLKIEDSGIGVHVSLGIESFFNKNLAVTFAGEYTFGSLKDLSIPLFNLEGESEEMPVEVDFGGLRLSVGIKFCLKRW